MTNYEIKDMLIVLNETLNNTTCLRLRAKIVNKIEKLVESITI